MSIVKKGSSRIGIRYRGGDTDYGARSIWIENWETGVKDNNPQFRFWRNEGSGKTIRGSIPPPPPLPPISAPFIQRTHNSTLGNKDFVSRFTRFK